MIDSSVCRYMVKAWFRRTFVSVKKFPLLIMELKCRLIPHISPKQLKTWFPPIDRRFGCKVVYKYRVTSPKIFSLDFSKLGLTLISGMVPRLSATKLHHRGKNYVLVETAFGPCFDQVIDNEILADLLISLMSDINWWNLDFFRFRPLTPF